MKFKLFFTSILSLLMVCLSYGQSTDKLNTAINTISNAKHREVIRASISKDINSLDEKYNLNPLMFAAMWHYDTLATALLEAGADPMCQHEHMGSILHLYLSHMPMHELGNRVCDIEMVKRFLKAGVDVNGKDPNEITPLIYAVQWTDFKVVSYLIEQGADVNAMAYGSRTPLTVARFRKKDDIVAILIQSGAKELKEEVVTQTESDEAPLSIEQILKNRAGQTSIDEISKLLESGLDTEDRYGRTPLTLAVECRYYDLVRALIEAGVDVNLNQPLITAIGSNDESTPDTELVLLLINVGADVDQTDKHSLETPLMQAVNFDDADIVEILIDYGADVNKKDNKGQTALSIAKDRCNERIVEILLANEAVDSFTPIEHISTTLNTLLNRERSKKMSKVYKMLSEGINSRDEEGRTVLIYAISNEDDFFGFPEDIFAELVKIEAIDVNAQDNEGFTALMYAANRQDTSYTQMLLDAGAKVNMADNEKRTTLFFAVSANRVEVARLLIANGAKVNVGNNSWVTPIVQADSPEMLNLLLDNGADVNAHNGGMTLLMKHLWNPRIDLVKVLLERNINVNATDEKGRTALDYTVHSLNSSNDEDRIAEVKEIINMLIKAGAKIGKPQK